ncbi:Gfo/Idh/MocA family protein [Microbacterium azadirachtae]|uniref:4-carboxy-2-hydroxymuconate semialdehyde dehydrogenase n=1 Tax=Microbacterium azadirachtae TaxID=582680 RepID=A0A1I6G650_9MICO|nr:Gfo/Idh/MocA family oxidoreductase [Microbacterium azadirachtae]SDL35340.1 4-carboxy-2-hydroxymuconate semialdehyde dehydrogenase [Microbacterium azadirachtae]SEF66062.1 4-carboxy-2-hydroxymuconate semialdehyde dehydrogenase [Microbacterium azadirachtae]SEF66823.1 4-carboxy-2-hydroxymuconate semialdehyde dehydrogenase [Microbacterium azadirachtae]SFR37659.1 4-carboxy-2-hydroxymuconate semialdehyde dehydrogenase [Microbacterium azadirachtae]
MTTPGIGIIGPGAIADAHAHALGELGIPIVAVAGPNKDDLEDFTRRHSIRRHYREASDLLADSNVDAVIIAAPSHVHAQLSQDAISAGKPVLCEIPLALNLADARKVVDLAEHRGLPFGVAHTLRYWEPHRQLARELTDSGQPALHVAVRSMMLRQSDVGWTGKQRDWTDSAVWHHGSHAVDAALWFLGTTITDVNCLDGREWTNGAVMDASFSLKTTDDRIGTVDLSYHSRRPKSDFLVITEHNTWEIDGGTLFRNGETISVGQVSEIQANAIREQDRTFIQAVDGKTADFFSAAHAIPALEILATSTQLPTSPRTS